MISESTVIPCIPTRDLATARRFYEDVIGLSVDMAKSEMGGVHYVVGTTGLFLYETEFAGTAKHTLCSFDSEHIDDDIAELRAKGVRFEVYDLEGVTFDGDVATMGEDGERGVWFKDPDGNVLGLFQNVRVPAGVS